MTHCQGSAVIGTFLGQIIFGIAGDVLGRKFMYGVALLIMTVGAVASAMAANTVRGMGVIGMLGIWRFVLGIGVGGDYPIAAVFTAEFASPQRRGMMVSAVFAMQGLGVLAASVVALLLLFFFEGMINADVANIDYVWRLCLGLAAVPTVVGAYFRLSMPETPRFTQQVEGNAAQAAHDVAQLVAGEHGGNPAGTPEVSVNINSALLVTAPAAEYGTSGTAGAPPSPARPVVAGAAGGTAALSPSSSSAANLGRKASVAEFRDYFGRWGNLKVLLGTAFTWFLLDVAYYGTRPVFPCLWRASRGGTCLILWWGARLRVGAESKHHPQQNRLCVDRCVAVCQPPRAGRGQPGHCADGQRPWILVHGVPH